ncbi:MAG: hypothetical protein ACLFRU_01940, partial [Paracoccaceae bacterium]
MSDLVFAVDAETMMAIAPETQIQLLESLARFEIAAFERARAMASPRSPEAAALELRREEALQNTLRQALWLGGREVARHPLRHVAQQLGIALDETDADWNALAYEATKVLLDLSRERGRRQQGLYDEPTVFFRRALSESGARATGPAVPPVDTNVTPAAFAIVQSAQAPAIEPAAFATCDTAPTQAAPVAASLAATTPASDGHVQPETDRSRPPGNRAAQAARLETSTTLTPAIIPAGLEMPEGYDGHRWQEARVATRPPRILIDRTLLSEGARAVLEKKRGITLGDLNHYPVRRLL